jgi:hypothetical protein
MPRVGQDPDSSAPLIFGTSVEVTTSDCRHDHTAADEATTPPCTTVVHATALADHAVLLAVPVTSRERQLSIQAPTGTVAQDGGIRAGSVVAVAPAPPPYGAAAVGASTRSGRPYVPPSGSAAPASRGMCEVQEDHDVCFRQGTRMCQLCKRWVCSEHASDIGGTLARCQACARDTRGSDAQRFECLESRCQALLCTLVCTALFVLFYLGPYRDGRK